MAVEILKKIWPEWQIGKRIGGGAYGIVYEATRNEYAVENHAAIKIISIPANEAEVDTLRSEGLDMPSTKAHFKTIVDDFVNEIRMMLSLEGCPNIVNVKDYKVVEKGGEFGWYIFILMELLTPFAVYTCDGTLSESEAIKLGCDICTALETCEEENIIHRDIKPGNILVHKNGSFKLGDFGIARKLENMTGGLSQRYTPKYMAPEVATSTHYDHRVDIYSLGIVLYQQLNRKCIPFQEAKQISTPFDIETAVRRRNAGEMLPAPCDASPAMADLILRACAFDPAVRFATATEMKQALMSISNGTYIIGAVNDLDRTTSVRKAPADYERTTSVRKAPAVTNRKSGQAVNTFGSAPKKNNLPKIIAAILALVILIGAGILALPKLFADDANLEKASEHIHSWNRATCISPQTCFVCGETLGLALGHDWLDASCAKPRTCSDCGQTEGSPLEHNWQSATCIQPCICSECGIKDGDAIGHQWMAATRTSPKSCISCGITLGSAVSNSLFSCPVFGDSNEHGSTTDVSIGSWVSMDGSTHTNAVKFWVMNKPGWANTEHILLDLNAKYETMILDLSIEKGSADGANAYVRIYLDGELSATSCTISNLEMDTMTLDVSGVKQVRIECITESSHSTYCIVDAWLSIP